jgi:predicted  nucleic acid-binding Zn-ribbon protein
MPGEIKELIDRAKAMIELNRNVGKFEKRERELTGQIGALKEQVEELKATIKVQDGTINALRQKVA